MKFSCQNHLEFVILTKNNFGKIRLCEIVNIPTLIILISVDLKLDHVQALKLFHLIICKLRYFVLVVIYTSEICLVIGVMVPILYSPCTRPPEQGRRGSPGHPTFRCRFLKCVWCFVHDVHHACAPHWPGWLRISSPNFSHSQTGPV